MKQIAYKSAVSIEKKLRSSKMAKMLLISSLMLLSINTVFSQWYGSINIDNYYDNNVFRSNQPERAFINSTSLLIGLSPVSSNFTMSYQGSLILSEGVSDLQYHTHSAGLSYTSKYGESNKNKINMYIVGNARFNSGYYVDYNNYSVRAGGSITHKFSETLIGKTGYQINSKEFSEISEYSYYEHYLFASLKKFFESRTSIHLDMNVASKSYSSLSNVFTKKGNNGNIRSYSQLNASVKVAQSLFENTGISAAFNKKFNLSGSDYTNQISYMDYYMESELYDDPYSYSSDEMTVTLTQMINSDIKLQATGFYYDKSYGYLVDNMIDTRADFKSGLSLSASMKLTDSWSVLNNPTIGIQYFYTKNISNLDYFNYNSSALNLTFKTNF
jgi:hypothetical protein